MNYKPNKNTRIEESRSIELSYIESSEYLEIHRNDDISDCVEIGIID